MKCPKCGKGDLVLKSGKHGEFWGCNQFSVTGCRYTTNELKTAIEEEADRILMNSGLDPERCV